MRERENIAHVVHNRRTDRRLIQKVIQDDSKLCFVLVKMCEGQGQNAIKIRGI